MVGDLKIPNLLSIKMVQSISQEADINSQVKKCQNLNNGPKM
jgi:hypothetical protein